MPETVASPSVVSPVVPQGELVLPSTQPVAKIIGESIAASSTTTNYS